MEYSNLRTNKSCIFPTTWLEKRHNAKWKTERKLRQKNKDKYWLRENILYIKIWSKERYNAQSKQTSDSDNRTGDTKQKSRELRRGKVVRGQMRKKSRENNKVGIGTLVVGVVTNT